MPNYTFVIKYVLDIEAEDEDEAYDVAYLSHVEGYNFEATLVRNNA